MGGFIEMPKWTCLDLRPNDPDDTLGRALYRQLAEAQARTDTAIQRAVRLVPDRAAGMNPKDSQ